MHIYSEVTPILFIEPYSRTVFLGLQLQLIKHYSWIQMYYLPWEKYCFDLVRIHCSSPRRSYHLNLRVDKHNVNIELSFNCPNVFLLKLNFPSHANVAQSTLDEAATSWLDRSKVKFFGGCWLSGLDDVPSATHQVLENVHEGSWLWTWWVTIRTCFHHNRTSRWLREQRRGSLILIPVVLSQPPFSAPRPFEIHQITISSPFSLLTLNDQVLQPSVLFPLLTIYWVVFRWARTAVTHAE